MNIAWLRQESPWCSAALADLVISGGDIRIQLNLNPSYDLGDLVAKIDRIDADLLNSLLTPTSGGVWVLPAPHPRRTSRSTRTRSPRFSSTCDRTFCSLCSTASISSMSVRSPRWTRRTGSSSSRSSVSAPSGARSARSRCAAAWVFEGQGLRRRQPFPVGRGTLSGGRGRGAQGTHLLQAA